MSIRVILADDHTILREGLRSLIDKEPGMEVVGEAGDGRTTARLVRDISPDVVIMDISMPHLNGIEATRQITNEFPDVKVISLSIYSDRRFVSEMIRAGASGYLIKDCAFGEVCHAIRVVVSNKIYLSPAIASIMVEDYLRQSPNFDNNAFSLLTNREREVLQLLAEGKTTKEIAWDLNRSIKTIETHRQQIMNKSDIHSIAELTKYAIREGITSVE
jgi:DNA-binding NarL/FixJ family response regulator